MLNITSRHGNKLFKDIHRILLIAIACTNACIWGADYTYAPLTPAALHKKIAKYEQLSQKGKDNALLAIVRKGGPDFSYPDRRIEIAALVHAGANVPAVQAQGSRLGNTLLPDVTLMRDAELVRFLINNNASISEQTHDRDTAIHEAKTVELAEPLLAKHALEHLNVWQIQKLLGRLAWPDYSPDLIPLYRQHGFNVMACNDSGYTLLMELTLWARQKPGIVKKAELLLEGLSIVEVKQYLAIKNHHRQTIFDLINQKASDPYSHPKKLYALRDFLRQRTDPEKYPDNPQTVAPKIEKQPEAIPECSVCLQPLDEQACTTTPCSYISY